MHADGDHHITLGTRTPNTCLRLCNCCGVKHRFAASSRGLTGAGVDHSHASMFANEYYRTAGRIIMSNTLSPVVINCCFFLLGAATTPPRLRPPPGCAPPARRYSGLVNTRMAVPSCRVVAPLGTVIRSYPPPSTRPGAPALAAVIAAVLTCLSAPMSTSPVMRCG